MTQELRDLLDELEIEIADVHAYRRPRSTMAVACLESMFRKHGYVHTKLVLSSVVDTGRNARELTAPVLWAISDIASSNPGWAARVSDWLSAFDRVDLGQLRAFAAKNKAVQARSGIASLLYGYLLNQFDPPQIEPKPRGCALRPRSSPGEDVNGIAVKRARGRLKCGRPRQAGHSCIQVSVQ